MYKLDKIQIKSKHKDYYVSFGKFHLGNILNQKDTFIILDSNLASVIDLPKSTNLIMVDPGEGTKDYSGVSEILSLLVAKGVNRNHTLAVIGGGSIQDVGTFVASIYMRGIEWIFFPTTLQAMADSCVGGKSAINLGVNKNLIGNYYPPKSISIDIAFTKSLSAYDLACGLIEALKITYASGPGPTRKFLKLLDIYLQSDQIDPELIEQMVHLSLICKKNFIEEDEFDHGIRKLLNFGHTYGHAIEASTSFKVHHGIAVGIGILASLEHRADKSLSAFEQSIVLAIRKLLNPFSKEIKQLVSEMSFESFSEQVQKDKKSDAEYLTFIHSIDGELKRVSLPNNEATRMDAYKSVGQAANAI
jgi:3-dehydroquinate synthase